MKLVLLYIFLILSQNAFAKQPSCDQLIGFVKIGQKYHVLHPVIDEEILPKVVKNYINILDPKKIYLTEIEYSKILNNVQKKPDFYLKKYFSKQCMFLEDIENKILYGEKRFKSFIKKTNPKEIKTITGNQEIGTIRQKNEFELKKMIFSYYGNEFYKNIKIKNEINKNSFFKELDKNRTSFLIKSFYKAFDPHSDYLDVFETKNFNKSTTGAVVGFGFIVNFDDIGIKIEKILDGGSAKSANLEPGDFILKINNKSVSGRDIDDLYYELVDQPEGTDFLFDVLKKDKKVIQITIKNQKINDKNFKVSSSLKKIDDKNILLVKIPSFYYDNSVKSGVSSDFLNQYNEFKSKNKIDGIILDLRDNYGGLLDEALLLTGYFIGDKVVVYSKDYIQTTPVFSPVEKIIDEPVTVLTNDGSASASEIVAGALKDYQRAVIIGEAASTFGKGTIQTVIDHLKSENLGTLKITIAKFYLPNGDSTQKKGVISDIVLPFEKKDKKMISEASLDNVLDWDTVDVKKVQGIYKFDLDKLIELSKKRVENIKNKENDDNALSETFLITRDLISFLKKREVND